jgi:hypothetical protein
MTQAVPINLIRWHYLWYVAVALAIMIAAIATHYLWFLNFIHVFCGLLWTGIDLFMGFVLGPILRVVDLAARKAVLLRLTPRTLFLMPTLAIITGTTGWYLAEDMGFTAISWPQYAWVAASLVLVILMSIQGIGYLLPTNFRVCLELQKDNPDNTRNRLADESLFFRRGTTGCDADRDDHHHGAISQQESDDDLLKMMLTMPHDCRICRPDHSDQFAAAWRAELRQMCPQRTPRPPAPRSVVPETSPQPGTRRSTRGPTCSRTRRCAGSRMGLTSRGSTRARSAATSANTRTRCSSSC